MYEAMATVIGTVVTHPVTRELNSGEQVLSFRVASNSRRFDQVSGQWVDSGTLFLTVSCWRRLVDGVGASIRRGDPVVVYGQLRSHEYRTKEGVERRDLEMRASVVGPDLTRCTARIVRASESASEANGVIRNTGPGSSAEHDARVGYGPGETAATVPSASIPSAEPEPVDV